MSITSTKDQIEALRIAENKQTYPSRFFKILEASVHEYSDDFVANLTLDDDYKLILEVFIYDYSKHARISFSLSYTSYDHEFTAIETTCDKIMKKADDEQCKRDKRQAVIASLTPEQREVLGF